MYFEFKISTCLYVNVQIIFVYFYYYQLLLYSDWKHEWPSDVIIRHAAAHEKNPKSMPLPVFLLVQKNVSQYY